MKRKELLDIMGELRRTGMVEKDEQIRDTLDELAKETTETLNLKKKGISPTAEDFLIKF
jgi:hypothetical protein